MIHENREIEVTRPDANSVVITAKSDTVFKNQTLILSPEEAATLGQKLWKEIIGQMVGSD